MTSETLFVQPTDGCDSVVSELIAVSHNLQHLTHSVVSNTCSWRNVRRFNTLSQLCQTCVCRYHAVTCIVSGLWCVESLVKELSSEPRQTPVSVLTLWCPLLPYGYSYKEHPVPDRLSHHMQFLTSGHCWRSGSARSPRCQKLQMTAHDAL